MKKTLLMATAAVAMLSMASCCGEKACKADSCNAGFDGDKVYTGVMPAADAFGIRYTLGLDYDDNGKKGDYTLVETYIVSDTTSALGLKDAASYASEGDFTVVDKNGKTFITLKKDAKDSSALASDNLIFAVDSDSTLTMANADYEVSTTPGMNYTLQLAK